MQIPTVSQLVKDTRYDGFLLVRAAEVRSAASGSRYVDMTLGDRTGDLNAKQWDGNAAAPAAGQVVRVRGQLLEYNGRLQLRVEKIRAAVEADNVPLETLVLCAPQPVEEMLQAVRDTVGSFANKALAALVTALLEEAGDALLTFPAAAKLHHAERGGLLHHTTSMLRMAGHFADAYPMLDGDLLKAGVVLHDLAKLMEMRATELGTVSGYTADGQLIGHLVRGVANIDAVGKRLQIDEELLLMVEHMVLSHHGVPEYGSPRPPMFPEAEVLHHLDTLDARLYEMRAALQAVCPGGFSERIWSLDRRLYRRLTPGPVDAAESSAQEETLS